MPDFNVFSLAYSLCIMSYAYIFEVDGCSDLIFTCSVCCHVVRRSLFQIPVPYFTSPLGGGCGGPRLSVSRHPSLGRFYRRRARPVRDHVLPPLVPEPPELDLLAHLARRPALVRGRARQWDLYYQPVRILVCGVCFCFGNPLEKPSSYLFSFS